MSSQLFWHQLHLSVRLFLSLLQECWLLGRGTGIGSADQREKREKLKQEEGEEEACSMTGTMARLLGEFDCAIGDEDKRKDNDPVDSRITRWRCKRQWQGTMRQEK